MKKFRSRKNEAKNEKNEEIITIDLTEERKDSNETELEPIEKPHKKQEESSYDALIPKETFIKKSLLEDYSVSPFFLMNLDTFEKHGGLQKLAKLIRENKSASHIISILEFIENLWNFFEKEYLMEFLGGVLEEIKQIPQKINEDEIKNSKKTEISELLHTIEFVYEKFYSQKELRMLIEIMELELYLMCFKSQYLEKRIFGLTNINNKIREASTNRKIETNYQYKILINSVNFNNYYKNGKESSIWLTPQYRFS